MKINMISVKEMKMPANCETCPFANTNSILFYCKVNVDDVKVYSMDNVGKRQADCPLILVDEDNDLISRKKALKTILGQPSEVHYPAWYAGQIKELPPAQPKRGKWVKISPARIYECSICGQNIMTDDIDCYKFCHSCGADMRGEKDE